MSKFVEFVKKDYESVKIKRILFLSVFGILFTVWGFGLSQVFFQTSPTYVMTDEQAEQYWSFIIPGEHAETTETE